MTEEYSITKSKPDFKYFQHLYCKIFIKWDAFVSKYVLQHAHLNWQHECHCTQVINTEAPLATAFWYDSLVATTFKSYTVLFMAIYCKGPQCIILSSLRYKVFLMLKKKFSEVPEIPVRLPLFTCQKKVMLRCCNH